MKTEAVKKLQEKARAFLAEFVVGDDALWEKFQEDLSNDKCWLHFNEHGDTVSIHVGGGDVFADCDLATIDLDYDDIAEDKASIIAHIDSVIQRLVDLKAKIK
jgi:hypothetical protein